MLPPSDRAIARQGDPHEVVLARHERLATSLLGEGYTFIGMMRKHLEEVSDLILAAEGVVWRMPDDESAAGILALDSQGDIAGVAILNAWGDDREFNIRLHHLSVVEHERGKGIGTVLAGMLTQATRRPASTTYAGIEPTVGAFRFYQKAGFDIHFPNEPILVSQVMQVNNNPRFKCWAKRSW